MDFQHAEMTGLRGLRDVRGAKIQQIDVSRDLDLRLDPGEEVRSHSYLS
jgi:hypothetical protein